VTVAVPLTALLPVHEPLAVHAVAFVEDHVRLAVLPSTIEVGATAIATVGAGTAVTMSAAVAWALPPAPLQVST